MNAPAPLSALPRRQFLERFAAFLAGTALLGRARPVRAAVQDVQPYLGEIALISWNFPPKGWTFCNGQVLPINQNMALYSLLGTQFGGNGTTTFALPNLQGRVAIHQGQGPGLTLRAVGNVVGETAHTLSLAELPGHTHLLQCSSGAATLVSPTGAYPARNPAAIPQFGTTADVAMAAGIIGSTGGSQPHENTQPYIVLNYIIALQGMYPS